MKTCTKEERELLDALKKASVITRSPYEGNKGELQVYRMRLFTPEQRRILRKALATGEGADFLGMPGSAGMMDELEMVNFEAHGKPYKEIARQI